MAAEGPRFSTPLSADSGLPPDLSFCLSATPSRRSRQREKEELRELNDRLAAYIQRVRASEAARAALHLRLDRCEEDASRGLGSLRRAYEDELAEARRALDHQALQRAALQVAADSLREEHRQLLARSSQKENELRLAAAHVKDLNSQLNSKEAQLATSLQRQQNLEKDLQESKDQIISFKELVNDSKNDLQNEKLKSADLENQVKTLQNQLAFLKTFHANELKNKKQLYEKRIQGIVSGHQQEFESKLMDLLQELRKEHQQQIKEYKDQMEQNFQAKVKIAQLSAEKSHDFANSLQEELKKTKLKVDNLMSQNNRLEARIRELEARTRELKKAIDCERDMSKRCLAGKEKEMAEIQQKMQAQLEDYELLLDVKLALDLEIIAYRTMLEAEEKRLKLSSESGEIPTGSGETRATFTQGHRLSLQGRKRKRVSARKQVHSQSFKVVQRASSSGSVSIEDIDAEGKFIKIKNNSNQIWRAEEGLTPEPSLLVWKSQRSWEVGENVSLFLHDNGGKETAEGKIIYLERGEGDGEMEDAAEETEREICSQQNESRSCPIM